MHSKVTITWINWSPSCRPYFALFTDEFCRFVRSLVDESLKGLLHRVDESFVACETALCNVVHLVLKVQQVLHHVLVFFWSAHYLSTKGLSAETVSALWLEGGPFVFDEVYTYLYIIPPELQQCGKSSFHLAEELVEEGQFSHTILIQQVSQTCNTIITVTTFVCLNCHH